MVSKIKSDEIEASTANGPISFNSEIKLKQYTTSQINALSGMSVGEMVFDTDLNYIKVYNGTTWGEVDVAAVWTGSGGTESSSVGYKYHHFTSSANFSSDAVLILILDGTSTE